MDRPPPHNRMLSSLTDTLFVVERRSQYRRVMRFRGCASFSVLTWAVRALAFSVGVAVVLSGALPTVGHSPTTAVRVNKLVSQESFVTSSASGNVGHRCNGPTAGGQLGSCVSTGFSAALWSAATNRVFPAPETLQVMLRTALDLSHQWRGMPPDRPPRA